MRLHLVDEEWRGYDHNGECLNCDEFADSHAPDCPYWHRKIVTPPDVAAALQCWRGMNNGVDRWATFEAVQFPLMRMSRVVYGNILSDGTKECELGTIHFSLDKEGNVVVSPAVHHG